ncbi:hypothetical protein BJF88_12010 [Cellulosimicrobium sp. CUA-896]|nr:hypothetical protein BJF88_12010 [Cellulosimicrobium sp. CUA-896]
MGGGPRAVAVVARLAARRRPDAPWGADPDPSLPVLRVAVVDRVEVGAGATWRTDQSPLLLNNTWAARTTVHADASTPMAGPVVTGPDLVDWARATAAAGETGTVRGGGALAVVVDEARRTGPGSYPSRRLQGAYYLDQLDEAARRGSIEVVPVPGTAVDLRTPRPGWREVVLATGDGATTLEAPVVVLAQGMVQAVRSARTERFAAAARTHGLVYVEPGMPAERDWDAVPAGEDVLVAGLGANFFDVLALLTVGRGGRFVDARTGSPLDAAGRSCDDGGADGPHAGDALRYVPGGAEPHLLAGSRRGLPYRGKGALADGLPAPYRARLATRARFDALLGRADGRPVLDLARDVWPLVARELVVAHLTALVEHRPSSLREEVDVDQLVARLDAADDPARVAADLVRDPADALDPRPAPTGRRRWGRTGGRRGWSAGCARSRSRCLRRARLRGRASTRRWRPCAARSRGSCGPGSWTARRSRDSARASSRRSASRWRRGRRRAARPSSLRSCARASSSCWARTRGSTSRTTLRGPQPGAGTGPEPGVRRDADVAGRRRADGRPAPARAARLGPRATPPAAHRGRRHRGVREPRRHARRLRARRRRGRRRRPRRRARHPRRGRAARLRHRREPRRAVTPARGRGRRGAPDPGVAGPRLPARGRCGGVRVRHRGTPGSIAREVAWLGRRSSATGPTARTGARA